MATMWRRAMHYLGLGPDDEYDDDVSYGGPADVGPPRPGGEPTHGVPQRAPVARTVRPPGVPQASQPPVGPASVGRPRPAATEGAAVRRLTPRGPAGAEPEQSQETPGPSTGQAPAPGQSFGVRQVATTARPHALSPTTFNEAQEIGDRFKAEQPIILNLQGADKELARRLIDFSSGLCYALGGQMEKVAASVYLITPTNVEISEDDRRKLREHGLASG